MNKYKITQIIGKGSFGTVHKAYDNKNNVYAIKKMFINDLFIKDKVGEQFNIMKQFNHPNLLKVYQCFTDQVSIYMVLQYCETDLLKYFSLKKKQISSKQIINIFRQIVNAFLILNSKGIIHRDLKPENVLVNLDGQIKIADFGCARKIDPEALSTIVKMSFDKGTAGFSAPEILKSQPYSSKCDIWSAGCLIYLLSTGKHPFLQSSIPLIIKTIEQKTYKKDIEIPLKQSITDDVKYIIRRCLKYNQNERTTWRQFSLCRVFLDKIPKVKPYLDYLKNLSNIVAWISQTFWKQRKKFGVSENKDEVFMYFIIKFQYSILQLGQKIIQKNIEFKYLFETSAWNNMGLDSSYIEEFYKYLQKTQVYFNAVKNAINSINALIIINEKKTQNFQCFSDLQDSIRFANKILYQLKQKPFTDKVLVIMARWINFQKWFEFSKRPTLDKLNDDNLGTLKQEYSNNSGITYPV